MKSKKKKNCEKRCGGTSVNGICLKEIKNLNFFLAANLCIHYKGLTLSPNIDNKEELTFSAKASRDLYKNHTLVGLSECSPSFSFVRLQFLFTIQK